MAETPSNQPLILVVEDTYVSADYVRRILIRKGFEVVVATNAADGLTVALARNPDLILLDVMLPDGDGFSLCERMKTHPQLAETPIVFVTSLEDVKSRVRGLSIGAVDYISKPFAAEEIVARVRVHVKIARQTRMLASAQSERLDALRSAQRLFLTNPQAVPAAQCAVYYESADEAGGDQYDLLELGTGIFGFLVADIAGHGMETIFQASALKALFRENASVLDSPSDTLFMINRSLRHHLADGQHLTAFYGVLNRPSSVLSFASAGHFPGLLVSPDGAVVRLASEGDVLGVFAEPRFQTVSVPVAPGSRIWLFTDGMLEDFDGGRTWRQGLERLEGAVAEHRLLPLEEALARVRREVVHPGPGKDDRILMAVEV